MATKIQVNEWKTKRTDKSEIIIDNYVTKPVQNIFRPLNILQEIVLSTNYRINNNFIFPIDWKNVLLSLMSVSIVITLFSTRIYKMIFSLLFKTPRSFSAIYLLCISLNFTLFIFGHIIVFIANTKYTNYYVQLFLNFQKILNSLNYTAKSINLYIFWNWFFCLANCVQFVIPYCLHFLYVEDFRFIEFASYLSLIVFDAGVVSSIRIAVFIKHFVNRWLDNIKFRKIIKVKASYFYCVKMFNVYVNIFTSYEMFVRVFQDLLIYWSLDAFVHSMIYVEQAVIKSQNHETSPIGLGVILWWTTKRIILIAILVLQIENIHIAMEKVQAYSLEALKSDCSEAERRMLKNIIRLHRNSFTRANARGLFHLDATLPLVLATNITNYTFVLLQFSQFNVNK